MPTALFADHFLLRNHLKSAGAGGDLDPLREHAICDILTRTGRNQPGTCHQKILVCRARI